MKTAALTLLAVSLAACTTAYGQGEIPTAPVAPSETCDAAPAQHHKGHDATAEMGAAIMKDTGAALLRWGPPDSVWTMDYRPDRVGVRYDREMKIVDITCG